LAPASWNLKIADESLIGNKTQTKKQFILYFWFSHFSFKDVQDSRGPMKPWEKGFWETDKYRIITPGIK